MYADSQYGIVGDKADLVFVLRVGVEAAHHSGVNDAAGVVECLCRHRKLVGSLMFVLSGVMLTYQQCAWAASPASSWNIS